MKPRDQKLMEMLSLKVEKLIELELKGLLYCLIAICQPSDISWSERVGEGEETRER